MLGSRKIARLLTAFWLGSVIGCGSPTTWSPAGEANDPSPAPRGPLDVGRIKSAADEAFDKGDLESAAQRYGQILQFDPHHLAARYNLGLISMKTRQPEQARRWFESVLLDRPSNPDCLYNLAVLDRQSDQPDRAIEQLEKLLEKEPGRGDAHALLGDILLTRDALPTARRHIDLALNQGDATIELVSRLAQAEQRQGQVADAARHYQWILKREPETLVARVGLSMSWLELGETTRALEEIERVRTRHPQEPGVLGVCGRILRRAGQLERALETLTTAQRLGFEIPGRGQAVGFTVSSEIGLTLLALGRLEEAETYFEMAQGSGLDLSQALAMEREALEKSEDDAQRDLIQAINTRLERAPTGRAMHEAPTGASPVASPPTFSSSARIPSSSDTIEVMPAMMTGDEDPLPTIGFREITRDAGVSFVHHAGNPLLYPTQILGPGVTFFDYDQDGWCDIATVDFAPPAVEDSPLSCVLYRNRGDGTFQDVTRESGLTTRSGALGILSIDLEETGFPDLVITGEHVMEVWSNLGDGTFRKRHIHGIPTDVGFFTSAAPVDFEGDGRFEIFVGGYSTYDSATYSGPPRIVELSPGRQVLDTLVPGAFSPRQNLILRRDSGDGFRATPSDIDSLPANSGRTLGLLTADFMGSDGRNELYVANDSTPNQVLVPKGSTLDDLAARAHLDDGRGSMGVALGTSPIDSRTTLFVTNWYRESNGLFVELKGEFTDLAIPMKLAQVSFLQVSWGCAIADLDLDGDDDLVYVNGDTTAGHYDRDTYLDSTNSLLPQPVTLFSGHPKGFEDATRKFGLHETVLNGRGLATGDIDNDGDLDLLIGENSGPLHVFRNILSATGSGPWIELDLVGTRSHRTGSGARIEVHAGNRVHRRFVQHAGSYLSSHQPMIHVGLGSWVDPVGVTIHWPSGHAQNLVDLTAGRIHRIVESGDGKEAGGGGPENIARPDL